MPMVALRGLVLFPKMVLHFDIGREKSIKALNDALKRERKIFLTAQRDLQEDNPNIDGLYRIGTIAEIKQVVKGPNGGLRVMAEGTKRAKLMSLAQQEPFLIGEVRPVALRRIPADSRDYVDALMRTVKDMFENYCSLSPKMPNELMLGVMMAQDPNLLAEFVAGNLPIPYEEKQEVLEESNVIRRLETLASIIENEIEVLKLEKDIYDRVQNQMDQNQREYYLREQMKVISEELGEDESPEAEVAAYIEKIKSLSLNDEANEKLIKEAHRLAKMPSNSQEAAVIRGYLDACLELPWNKKSEVSSDVIRAQQILDHDHYGMKKVKERIVEAIAVHALAPDQKGQILCLVGPPGVGKTSIAQSIARATGRNYARISLGGVKDESDIRGHRKTYIGSMPGRIIDALRRAGTKNALILLDEVDKLGGDYKGDPSSALLEVLDAEQNHSFRDHFIELPFDLSEVLFIATANNAEGIPGPLYDRMEVIELPSYTREEKLRIAKEYLVPKQRVRNGLDGKQARITEEALYTLIDSYTREAGVRTLERLCASVFRKCACRIVAGEVKSVTVTPKALESMLGPKKFFPDDLANRDEVGVTNGLAWTSVGGEMLQVEVAVLEGTGKIEITGQLGDVMKESAHAAVTCVRANAERYNISKTFYKDKDLHIHVPEGAVPKDGPSAGITMATAILSALSGRAVRHDVAMTGEITLRGRVLPIGGLREKSMAAYRNNIKTVIIPKANAADLAELDPVVREGITFVPVSQVDEVFEIALTHEELPVEKEEAHYTVHNTQESQRTPVTC
ncbi:MAG: endopeptidase La [Oscillospiraceae bacterium]|nr:endopeptidase La [Oscillospiraceae bacterium]